MGILDGILGPALTVATDAAGAQQKAQLESKLQQRAQAIQALLMQHQFQKDQAQQDYQRKMGDAAVLRGQHYQTMDSKPPHESPHFITEPDGTVVSVTGNNPATPVQGPDGKPVKSHLPSPPMAYSPVATLGPDGKPATGSFNKRTGEVSPGSVPRPATGGGNGRENAQLATASGQAVDADQSMQPYEADLLSGKEKIGASESALAKKMFTGGTGAAVAESMLNTSNPRLAQYVRDAKAVATAERMITPRGGSNVTTQAEAMLSGVGPNATPAQITRARQYRARLIEGLKAHGQSSGPTPSTGVDPFHDLVPSGAPDE